MKVAKQEISKELVIAFFDETDTTPEQFIEWLQWAVKHTKDTKNRFPCNEKSYCGFLFRHWPKIETVRIERTDLQSGYIETSLYIYIVYDALVKSKATLDKFIEFIKECVNG